MQTHLTRAEIDLSAIAHNVHELRRLTNPAAGILAAVKANAYGHGAVETARQVLKSGVDMLGVARLEEGIELRKAGIDAPILIFGYTAPEMGNILISHDLTATVYSADTARLYASTAVKQGKKIKIHLKVDSGMGRLGFVPDGLCKSGATSNTSHNAFQEIVTISALSNLEIEGIYSHFATADSQNKAYAKRQFNIFLEFLEHLRQNGLEFPLKHAANSAALIEMPETHLDLVRPGIALYGLKPSSEANPKNINLKPALSLKTGIIHLKKVPAGFNVSYGCTYTTDKTTTLATVPVGYADGYSRLLSSRGKMLVHGCRAPIVGRVCMDLTILDVGQIPQVKLEDEVVIIGSQGEERISAEEIATTLNTINYEIVSAISARVPRIIQP